MLNFIETFHREVAKRLDAVDSAGEAAGLMEWANGRVGKCDVYFLWFPATKRLVYTIKCPAGLREGEVEAKSHVEAVAHVEKIIASLRR